MSIFRRKKNKSEDKSIGQRSASEEPTQVHRPMAPAPAPPPPQSPAGQGLFADSGHSSANKRRRAPALEFNDRPDDGSTRLITPKGATTQPEPSEKPASNTSDEVDPVAGWLVVVKGPGRGRDLKVGHGINEIGRGADCRIRLDFGDNSVSREPNSRIVHDPLNNRTHVQQDRGKNLVYHNGEAILMPIELKSGDKLRIGETELVFVRFSPDFHTWDDDAT